MRIYLACPYSDPEEAVRGRRFVQVSMCAAQLMQEGHNVFSPITHSHFIAQLGDLPQKWDFWRQIDFEYIERFAEEVWVLMLPGWEKSVGVRAETSYAEELGIPVKFLDPEAFTLEWPEPEDDVY